jgi:hypothetical protein
VPVVKFVFFAITQRLRRVAFESIAMQSKKDQHRISLATKERTKKNTKVFLLFLPKFLPYVCIYCRFPRVLEQLMSEQVRSERSEITHYLEGEGVFKSH